MTSASHDDRRQADFLENRVCFCAYLLASCENDESEVLLFADGVMIDVLYTDNEKRREIIEL